MGNRWVGKGCEGGQEVPVVRDLPRNVKCHVNLSGRRICSSDSGTLPGSEWVQGVILKLSRVVPLPEQRPRRPLVFRGRVGGGQVQVLRVPTGGRAVSRVGDLTSSPQPTVGPTLGSAGSVLGLHVSRLVGVPAVSPRRQCGSSSGLQNRLGD